MCAWSIWKETKKVEEDEEKAIVLEYSVIAMKTKVIREKKQDNPASMSVNELCAVLIPLHHKHEPAVTNKCAHLIEKFNEWKDWPYRKVGVIGGSNGEGGNTGEGGGLEEVVVPNILLQYEGGLIEGSNNNEDAKI